MKNITSYLVALVIGITAISCDKPIDEFNNSTNYIGFNMPFQLDQFGRPETTREDSLIYSFAMDDLSVTEYTFKIPVNAVGLKVGHDRAIKIVVESTNASPEDWDQAALTKTVISAGQLIDTLRVTVKRVPALKNEMHHIAFRLEPNEYFELGANELLRAKVAFTDVLTPPSWWKNWIGIFGEFSREKYAKWQEIYYLGVDPNTDLYGPDPGKQLYWGYMPFYPYSNWYPSTFMFIGRLKQYFIDNEVYPDNDRSKPRITLP